jgi:glycosyltransferase involved in cell wall biosynthesis
MATAGTCESIAINGRFLTQPTTGVQRYAYELLRCLDRLLSEGSVFRIPATVFVPTSAAGLPEYSYLQVRRVGRLSGRMWEHVELPRYSGESLLFTPCGGAPLRMKRQAITIHDAGPFSTPDSYTAPYRIYYRALQRGLARRKAHIITVSRFSRCELSRALHLAEDDISFAWLSGEHMKRFQPAPDVLTKYHLEKNGYVLGIGSSNPNKNIAGLIAARGLVKTEHIDFAIVGDLNPRIFRTATTALDGVRRLGSVDDSTLRTLYENAACLVFPSFYEGFGLPPLEALTLGCPIVVSRAASLPEVFGSAAVYCDPHSPQNIADQILRVLNGDHPTRDSALAHAATFTWERCARQTWDILLRTIQQ